MCLPFIDIETEEQLTFKTLFQSLYTRIFFVVPANLIGKEETLGHIQKPNYLNSSLYSRKKASPSKSRREAERALDNTSVHHGCHHGW